MYRNFIDNFLKGECIFIEDSILWYALEYNVKHYLSLNINQRINFKQSYFI